MKSLIGAIANCTSRGHERKRIPDDRLAVCKLFISFTFCQNQQAGDFDISSYAHQEVDRYGILMDLWTNEAAFLEAKKNVS